MFTFWTHLLTATHTCTSASSSSPGPIFTQSWSGDGMREPEGLVYHKRTCIFIHVASLEEILISGLWSMCESKKVKYLIYKHHPTTWETRALKHQMIIYSHVTLRDLRPALCLHMLKGSHVAPSPPPAPLAIKERCCSTHNQPHSDVSTCLSSNLT